ncbi:MAG TPA: 30S ribosomal protein S5 [Patescibacteria group bacterium]|nr:30S ribosomal protein S5 [Patescibacteria group bacterium]
MLKGKNNRGKFKKERPEFDQNIIDLARVTRVTKGGKQLSFRALVLIGDRKGRVGYGVDKGKDVQLAVNKAVNQAKKNLITVPSVYDTIPHRVEAKYNAAVIMLKPAPKGSGIIAGGAVRNILELAGVANASARILGRTGSPMNNIKAAFLALQSFKPIRFRQEKGVAKVEGEKGTEPKVTSNEQEDKKKLGGPKKKVEEKKKIEKTNE